MNVAPEKQQQIAQFHAPLIVNVVNSISDTSLRPGLEQVLKTSAENGWENLVAAIRKVLKGERDSSILNGLDEEDQVIIDAILKGIQNPATMPDPNQEADPSKAAPMLAQLIHDASKADTDALSMLGQMAEQMSTTQGDLARFSTLIKPLVDGERDVDKLCDKIGPQGESLVTAILNELGKLDSH
ncbi:MAG TPA: hypothetical protein ENJ08_16365 [Gammaproteobacteria bacterium]|nr:hypothetical protein [Gammaproteobacteria bacterium]